MSKNRDTIKKMENKSEDKPFDINTGLQQSLYERCFDILHNTHRDRQKITDRKKFLLEHPEARRNIDTGKLRQIIDYQDFRCHPQCSVARNEAITGSDIDGGLVVLKNEVSIEQQLAFVEELRRQGFSAFHPLEVQEREQQVNQAVANGLKGPALLRELVRKSCEAESVEISFYTTAQLEEMKNQPLINPTLFYVAGKSIK